MWKLFIWGIILGICGLGNFQFSAEFNIYEIENQKIMHRSPLFDFRPVKFTSKLHRKVVQIFFLAPKFQSPAKVTIQSTAPFQSTEVTRYGPTHRRQQSVT